MPTITTQDGTNIFYKDCGQGRHIMFSHGWPLQADSWDEQLVFFASQGFRAIAHDRRSHGRSTQTSEGNEMNTYADDLKALKLDLRDAVLVGHSTGGGEVTRYLGRHGSQRVGKVVLVGAVPPLMLKTERNPLGLHMSAFDNIRQGVMQHRSQFYRELALPFYGLNRSGSKAPQGLVEQFWLWSMQAGLKGALDCIRAFSETDFSEDLQKFDKPTLFVHGDDDQIVPIDAAARSAVKRVKGGVLKEYEHGDHGLMVTHQERFNKDLLAFIRG